MFIPEQFETAISYRSVLNNFLSLWTLLKYVLLINVMQVISIVINTGVVRCIKLNQSEQFTMHSVSIIQFEFTFVYKILYLAMYLPKSIVVQKKSNSQQHFLNELLEYNILGPK